MDNKIQQTPVEDLDDLTLTDNQDLMIRTGINKDQEQDQEQQEEDHDYTDDEIVELHDPDEQDDIGNSGKLGASFNFINSILGAGIIGLPFAIKECGFYLGVILLLLVAMLTYHGVNIIIICGLKVRKRSYEGLIEHVMGVSGYITVSLFMFIFAFGAMCAYLIIIGDTIPEVIDNINGSSPSKELVIFVIAFIIILPLCLLKDMSALSSTSFVSIMADVGLVAIILLRAPQEAAKPQYENTEADFSFAKPTVFAGLGAMSFAYVCHHSSFLVFNTLKVPTVGSWKIISRASILFAFTCSMLLGLGGFLSFFNETKGDVLKNFDNLDPAINVARVLLAITMILTFPMECFVARHSLHAVLFHGRGPITNRRHYALTLGLWLVALIIGMTVEDLGVVLELTGAFSASMLGYILPALVYFKIHPIQDLNSEIYNSWNKNHPQYRRHIGERFRLIWKVLPTYIMLLFGLLVLVIGSVQSLTKTGSDDDKNEFPGTGDFEPTKKPQMIP